MSKQINKLVAAALSLALALSLAACAQGNPAQQAEAAVTGFFHAVQQADMNEAAKYTDAEQVGNMDELTTLPDGGKKIMEAMFGKLEYELVGSEQISGEEVRVTVKISAVDMAPIFKQYMAKAMEYLFTHALDEPAPSEQEVMTQMSDIFVQLLAAEDVAMMDTQVEITVAKTDGKWKIKVEETFLSAVLGGFDQAVAQLEEELG